MNTSDLRQKLKQAHEVNRKLRAERDRLQWALENASQNPDVLWLFENREERMDANSPLFDAERAAFHLDRYNFVSDFVSSVKVLDIACGTGYGAKILAKAGASNVIGVDINAEVIQYAEKHYGSPNIHFLVGNAAQIPIDSESIDVITSFETIEHVENDREVINEFARVLKPGGYLLISTPNEWPLEIAPYHYRSYNRESFLALLQPKFHLKELFNQNSGSRFKFNHNQPRGISRNTDANNPLAECFIAIAIKR